jgi:hypothetical protein
MSSSSSSFSPLIIDNAHENRSQHDVVISSASSLSTSSSSSSSPDRQVRGYQLLNDKSRRKKRSFMPDDRKDPIYWSQRSKNNQSAQRSRVKRRVNDLVLETKLTHLSNENQILRAKIDMLARKFGNMTNDDESIDTVNENLSEERTALPATLDSNTTDPTEEQSLLVKTNSAPVPSVSMKWRLKLFSSTSNS